MSRPPTKTQWTRQAQHQPVSCFCLTQTVHFNIAHLSLKMSLSALYSSTPSSRLHSLFTSLTKTLKQFTLCNSKNKMFYIGAGESIYSAVESVSLTFVLMWNFCVQASIHHTSRWKLLEHLSLGWTDLACWLVSENTSCWEVVQPLPHIFKKSWDLKWSFKKGVTHDVRDSGPSSVTQFFCQDFIQNWKLVSMWHGTELSALCEKQLWAASCWGIRSQMWHLLATGRGRTLSSVTIKLSTCCNAHL